MESTTNTKGSNMTNTEAQAYLAEQLPERIGMEITHEVESGKPVHIIWWRHKDSERYPTHRTSILETEWLHIAHEIEGKMTAKQYDAFVRELQIVLAASNENWMRLCISATYTQRAQAMKESGIKL